MMMLQSSSSSYPSTSSSTAAVVPSTRNGNNSIISTSTSTSNSNSNSNSSNGRYNTNATLSSSLSTSTSSSSPASSPTSVTSSSSTTPTPTPITITSAEKKVREVASKIGLNDDSEVLNRVCWNMRQELVIKVWQLPALDSYQWKTLEAPIGLAAAVQSISFSFNNNNNSNSSNNYPFNNNNNINNSSHYNINNKSNPSNTNNNSNYNNTSNHRTKIPRRPSNERQEEKEQEHQDSSGVQLRHSKHVEQPSSPSKKKEKLLDKRSEASNEHQTLQEIQSNAQIAATSTATSVAASLEKNSSRHRTEIKLYDHASAVFEENESDEAPAAPVRSRDTDSDCDVYELPDHSNKNKNTLTITTANTEVEHDKNKKNKQDDILRLNKIGEFYSSIVFEDSFDTDESPRAPTRVDSSRTSSSKILSAATQDYDFTIQKNLVGQGKKSPPASFSSTVAVIAEMPPAAPVRRSDSTTAPPTAPVTREAPQRARSNYMPPEAPIRTTDEITPGSPTREPPKRAPSRKAPEPPVRSVDDQQPSLKRAGGVVIESPSQTSTRSKQRPGPNPASPRPRKIVSPSKSPSKKQQKKADIDIHYLPESHLLDISPNSKKQQQKRTFDDQGKKYLYSQSELDESPVTVKNTDGTVNDMTSIGEEEHVYDEHSSDEEDENEAPLVEANEGNHSRRYSCPDLSVAINDNYNGNANTTPEVQNKEKTKRNYDTRKSAPATGLAHLERAKIAISDDDSTVVVSNVTLQMDGREGFGDEDDCTVVASNVTAEGRKKAQILQEQKEFKLEALAETNEAGNSASRDSNVSLHEKWKELHTILQGLDGQSQRAILGQLMIMANGRSKETRYKMLHQASDSLLDACRSGGIDPNVQKSAGQMIIYMGQFARLNTKQRKKLGKWVFNAISQLYKPSVSSKQSMSEEEEEDETINTSSISEEEEVGEEEEEEKGITSVTASTTTTTTTKITTAETNTATTNMSENPKDAVAQAKTVEEDAVIGNSD